MKNYQILIVDDDPVFSLLTVKFLEIINFDDNLHKFSNGLEALHYFEKVYNQKELFVILLDINMPVMNGWKFLDALKKKAYRRNTYVYLITASTDIAEKEKAGTYSIVRGIETKPLTAEKLGSVKETVLLSLKDRSLNNHSESSLSRND